MLLFLSVLRFAFAQDIGNPIEEFVVQGEVQKPTIFMSINKKNTSKAYELDLKKTFIPKILDSMKKEPL